MLLCCSMRHLPFPIKFLKKIVCVKNTFLDVSLDRPRQHESMFVSSAKFLFRSKTADSPQKECRLCLIGLMVEIIFSGLTHRLYQVSEALYDVKELELGWLLQE